MKKAKTKSTKKLKKVKSKKLFWQYLFVGSVLVVLLASFLIPKNPTNPKETAHASNSKSKIAAISYHGLDGIAQLASISPTLAATKAVTLTPKPTQQPVQSGYCLNVPVILYHHIQPMAEATKANHPGLTVDPSFFELHLQYLNDHGYKTITAEQLANALISHQPLPGKSIVLTLDDGYKDAYTYAYPLAKKYNIILNLMIPSGLLGNGDYLSWNDLKDMVGSGLIYAYDHSWSHFSLPSGNDEKITYEIMTAKRELEEQLGKPQKIFTYPYGSYNGKAIEILQKNGFIAAFTTVPSRLQCDSFMMTLHRDRVGNASLASYGL